MNALDANEVVPGLYQGSRPKPGCYPVNLLLLMALEYQPQSYLFPCIDLVVRAPIDDNPAYVPPEDHKTILSAAGYVMAALRAGRRVLVTCNMGLNRSGVVCALVLRDGFRLPPQRAIDIVRKARGPDALSNPEFEAIVRGA